MRLRPEHRLFVLATAAMVLCTVSAYGHTPLFSQSEFHWEEPNVVRAVLVFHWRDAVFVSESLDKVPGAADQDAGSLSDFEPIVASGIEVYADDERCPGRLEIARPYQGDGFLFAAAFRCPHRAGKLRIALPLLRILPDEHRHLLRVQADQVAAETTLSRSRDSFDVSLSPAASSAAAPNGERTVARVRDAIAFGIRHIVLGWDHLLFLVALAFGVPRWRAAILPVSAFTVAHTLTLACAALGIFALSPRIVEPAIAASIAYVAFENVIRPTPAHRSIVTFTFGLVHGFGFAGALTELALDRARLVPMLLGFNVGVELGQLAFLSIVLPIVLWLRASKSRQFARGTCLVIGTIACGLCIFRLFGA